MKCLSALQVGTFLLILSRIYHSNYVSIHVLPLIFFKLSCFDSCKIFFLLLFVLFIYYSHNCPSLSSAIKYNFLASCSSFLVFCHLSHLCFFSPQFLFEWSLYNNFSLTITKYIKLYFVA